MNGLYRTDREDSFVTDDEIIHDLETAEYRRVQDEAQVPEIPPIFVTKQPHPRGFEYWSARMQDRQRVYLQESDNPNNIEIAFANTTLLCFMSDLHVGGVQTDYSRIEQECEAIVQTPNAYVWVVGDWVDNFFFNPAEFEQLEMPQEQYLYTKEMFRYLADNGKLLIATLGNHDKWAARSGVDPYGYIATELGAYYTHGITYLTARVGPQFVYRITGNHKWKGSSIYNNVHSEMRAYKFDGANNSDVVVGGHYHTKGIMQQPVDSFGNTSNVVTFISLGSYKMHDEFTRNQGFGRRAPESMFGAAVALRANKHGVKPYYDIVEACLEFDAFQRWVWGGRDGN